MAAVKRRNWLGLLAGAMALVLIGGGTVWVYRAELQAATLEFGVAQTGMITHEVKVKAVFANQETVLTAPVAGQVNFNGQDGQRFRRGDIVAAVQPAGANPGATANPAAAQAVATPLGGLFFRETDGLESVMTPDNLMNMDLSKLLAEKGTGKVAGQVQAGEPIGKIVNNLGPSLAFLAVPALDGLEVGQTLRLTVEGKPQTAKIRRKSASPLGVVVQFNQYVDGSTTQRVQDIIWIVKPGVTGVVLPKRALWQQGEEQGVLVVVEGVIRFRRVKVLDQDGERICVENIPTGMPIVLTPRSGLEGLAAHYKS